MEIASREDLMKRVMAYGFAAHEWNLYLDTHPHDKKALTMFHEVNKKALELRMEYENMYGPLMVTSSSSDRWDWIEEPWPWDNY